MTYVGATHRLLAFDEWCERLPLSKERILVCAGNHVLTLEREPELARHAFVNCTYLLDEAHRDQFGQGGELRVLHGELRVALGQGYLE